jgi:hypothetical protein
LNRFIFLINSCICPYEKNKIKKIEKMISILIIFLKNIFAIIKIIKIEMIKIKSGVNKSDRGISLTL